MSIKPVGEIFDFNASLEATDDQRLPILYEAHKHLPAGTLLYAIPDTHRLVPASALAGVLQLAGYAVPYTDHDGQLRADFGVISDALQAVTP